MDIDDTITNKTYVLWSGGLDSTYLIQKLLEDGRHVVASYVEIKNNKAKTKMELKAIKNLIEQFKQNHYYSRFKYTGVCLSLELNSFSNIPKLSQMPVWMSAAMMTVPPTCKSVAFGYVMSDQAASYTNEFRQVLRSYFKMWDTDIKIEFPILKIPKEEIISLLNKQLAPHVVTCQTPIVCGSGDEELYYPCRTCESCLRDPTLKYRPVFEAQQKELCNESKPKTMEDVTCSEQC